MKIAIIGTGNLGGAIANGLIKQRHNITLSYQKKCKRIECI